MYKDKNLTGHLCMFAACAAWGLMSPLGKDAMAHGISGLALVSFRAAGAALCFWLTSLFGRHKEEVAPRDLLMFFFAGMLAIVFNQCCFTIGLSLTSPVNASIVTTTLPIVTMILAALFLKEPVTNKKVLGIFCGAIGALLLILGNGHATQKGNGSLTGDPAVPYRPMQLCRLPDYLQEADTEIHRSDLHEMDVHLRHHRHPALHLQGPGHTAMG